MIEKGEQRKVEGRWEEGCKGMNQREKRRGNAEQERENWKGGRWMKKMWKLERRQERKIRWMRRGAWRIDGSAEQFIQFSSSNHYIFTHRLLRCTKPVDWWEEAGNKWPVFFWMIHMGQLWRAEGSDRTRLFVYWFIAMLICHRDRCGGVERSGDRTFQWPSPLLVYHFLKLTITSTCFMLIFPESTSHSRRWLMLTFSN